MRSCRVKLRAHAGFAAAALCLFASTGVAVAQEESNQAEQIRYHFGDDPGGKLGWADPNFDDSAWPAAKNGLWPMPSYQSNGFLWVRTSVPVRDDANGLLSVRLLGGPQLWVAYGLQTDAIYVNGIEVGQDNNFPGQGELRFARRDSIFVLPEGLAKPGETATIALRAWYPPYLRQRGVLGHGKFEIDVSRNLELAQQANNDALLLASGPQFIQDMFVALLGLGLLILWRRIGGRELLVCGGMLVLFPVYLLCCDFISLALIDLPQLEESLSFETVQATGMFLLAELIWTLYGLGGIALKRTAEAAVLVFAGADLIARALTHPSRFGAWIEPLAVVAVQSFNLINLYVCVRELYTHKGNRWIAFALAQVPLCSLLEWFGLEYDFPVRGATLSLFSIATFIAEVALFFLLADRAWRAWRARDELRVEFEAAREVQQQLVVPAVDVPGFRIESAYAPAKQVGGDFFRVLPEADGGVLIVTGDVSGKGLKAAMTVSAIMGALRGCDSHEPSKVLEYLNRVLFGQIGGFVTCCVALITSNGAMTIANAGNPAPYRNGEEMPVESGLPLGMIAEVAYIETRYQLDSGDRLTFVSDGVIEATSPTGELYGFERTQAISNQPAHTIAEAVKQFGQEDDITVLTLERTPIPA